MVVPSSAVSAYTPIDVSCVSSPSCPVMLISIFILKGSLKVTISITIKDSIRCCWPSLSVASITISILIVASILVMDSAFSWAAAIASISSASVSSGTAASAGSSASSVCVLLSGADVLTSPLPHATADNDTVTAKIKANILFFIILLSLFFYSFISYIIPPKASLSSYFALSSSRLMLTVRNS